MRDTGAPYSAPPTPAMKPATQERLQLHRSCGHRERPGVVLVVADGDEQSAEAAPPHVAGEATAR